jgi:hypothetical protein
MRFLGRGVVAHAVPKKKESSLSAHCVHKAVSHDDQGKVQLSTCTEPVVKERHGFLCAKHYAALRTQSVRQPVRAAENATASIEDDGRLIARIISDDKLYIREQMEDQLVNPENRLVLRLTHFPSCRRVWNQYAR